MSEKLNIWILQTGEPIHLDDEMPRPMRGMNLTNKLVELGHNVNFISSVFHHQKKIHRSNIKKINEINPQLKITLIDSPGYNKNISIGRFYDHLVMAYNLRIFLRKTLETPDVVFIGYPPIEISFVMSMWLKKKRIPFILDIKDQWPDIILDALPNFTKFIGRLFLSPYYYMAKKTINNANAITSMSKSFIQWSNVYNNNKITKILPLVPSKNLVQEHELIDAEKWCDEIGIEKDPQTNIFFSGTLSMAFDFDVIIQCAREMTLYNKDIKFVICGNGEYKKLLEKESKNLPNLIITGWVNINKIKAIANRSKFAIAPYKNIKNFTDNIPNKIIDYLSFGLPIITPLKGEVSDLIISNSVGMNYKEHSKNSLRDVIIYLSKNNSLREKFSYNAIRLYNKDYSYDYVYGNAVKLIEEIQLLNKK